MGSAPIVEVNVVPICHLKTMKSVPEEEFVVSIHWHFTEEPPEREAGSADDGGDGGRRYLIQSATALHFQSAQLPRPSVNG